jgi:microcystin-dependent protein
MNFFLGQIGIYGFNFAPRGWALCGGSLLPIAQNTALFSLLGTTYGGNGQTTFALPDLRSRTPIGFDGSYPLGQAAGVENVTLINSQMPQHNHLMAAVSTPSDTKLDGAIFGKAVSASGTAENFYGPPIAPVTLNAQSIALMGGSQPHANLQPLLAVNFCISTTGIYPSRS